MHDRVDRRRFLRGAAGGAAVGAAALAGCGRPATEEELAESGAAAPAEQPWYEQAAGEWGGHELMPLPYAYDALVLSAPGDEPVKGISEQVVRWHHDKHHAGYVKALNTIESELAAMESIEASANYSPFAELKRRETFNASGMYLHDVYWRNMTPGGKAPSDDLAIVRKLAADFGSFEQWRDVFVGTANTPNTGWAILAISPYDRRLHNYACSFHDLGGVWGAVPLVACDVWEHAYYYDYGPDRGSYIESFLRLLDWPAIDRRFRQVAEGMVFG